VSSDISDITWAMMTEAGIDTGLVSLRPTPDGSGEYILIDGDLKVAFGPSVTEQGNAAAGWEVSAYQRESDDEGPYWQHVRQDSATTTGEALRLVAEAVAFGA
jgi:hypothetical protein